MLLERYQLQALILPSRRALTESQQAASTSSLLARAGDVGSWSTKLQQVASPKREPLYRPLYQETEYLCAETACLEKSREELEHATLQLAKPERVPDQTIPYHILP